MPSRLNPRSAQQNENEPNQRHSLEPDSHSDEARKRPKRNKSAPPSTITIQHQEDETNIILRLADCCSSHQAFHASNPVGNHLDRCLSDLEIVKRILPRVEKKYRYRPRAKSSKSNKPEAMNVMHLCSFYRDVLKGGYCPEAPALFQTPEKMPDVHEGVS